MAADSPLFDRKVTRVGAPGPQRMTSPSGGYCISRAVDLAYPQVDSLELQLKMKLAVVLFSQRPCPCDRCIEFGTDVLTMGGMRWT